MKLATLPSDNRDGRLVVVSDDLQYYLDADAIAPNLQYAVENWQIVSPLLEALAQKLADNPASGKAFDQKIALSPLPRAYAWADGSAYVNHVELVRKARGAEMPASFWQEPLMYQGGSDSFLAPYAPIMMADEAWGIDMEAEIAVITNDVPMGADYETAKNAILLIMLVNDVSLRGLIPAELAKGFGFFQSKPSSAFSPIAVTPDMLGEAWDGGKLHLAMRIDLNGQPLGRVQTGVDMIFDIPTLIMHAAKTRNLCAGTIIGSGTISNKSEDGGAGKPISEGGVGYSCLAELRTIETILHGKPATPFMRFGDNVTIDMHDAQGKTIFGMINQTIMPYKT